MPAKRPRSPCNECLQNTPSRAKLVRARYAHHGSSEHGFPRDETAHAATAPCLRREARGLEADGTGLRDAGRRGRLHAAPGRRPEASEETIFWLVGIFLLSRLYSAGPTPDGGREPGTGAASSPPPLDGSREVPTTQRACADQGARMSVCFARSSAMISCSSASIRSSGSSDRLRRARTRPAAPPPTTRSPRAASTSGYQGISDGAGVPRVVMGAAST